jgi:hypothetical protein
VPSKEEGRGERKKGSKQSFSIKRHFLEAILLTRNFLLGRAGNSTVLLIVF